MHLKGTDQSLGRLRAEGVTPSEEEGTEGGKAMANLSGSREIVWTQETMVSSSGSWELEQGGAFCFKNKSSNGFLFPE